LLSRGQGPLPPKVDLSVAQQLVCQVILDKACREPTTRVAHPGHSQSAPYIGKANYLMSAGPRQPCVAGSRTRPFPQAISGATVACAIGTKAGAAS
jgi:hypothetical protein